MLVDGDAGYFKVGIQHSEATTGHSCYVYDSATGAWSALGMLCLTQAHVQARAQWLKTRALTFPDMDALYYDLTTLGMYDIRRCEWSIGSVVRNLRFTTGLEGGKHTRCVLPRPGVCTSRLWEWDGQRYFASGWVYAGSVEDVCCGVDGFGIWRVDEDGSLVTVSAVTVAICSQYPQLKPIVQLLEVVTAADANLVCFSERCPAMLSVVVVYDLHTSSWSRLAAQRMDHYSEAVVYQPSLRPVRKPWQNQTRAFPKKRMPFYPNLPKRDIQIQLWFTNRWSPLAAQRMDSYSGAVVYQPPVMKPWENQSFLVMVFMLELIKLG
ncbi:hypothetical protein SELMODRAFT_421063 [Selaginella moellendorffii]|uniref:Uncharacterized protein n=1 Tax=Selaginella moellendorffii TaxID=88036 RepID=D8SE06_SELML|nr:hypothetical protein SELMODRAFT_421063 [Selaginella moellendorffii]